MILLVSNLNIVRVSTKMNEIAQHFGAMTRPIVATVCVCKCEVATETEALM